MLSLLLTPLLAGVCFAGPLGPKKEEFPVFATDSVATFTWADATQTTVAVFTNAQRREASPTRAHHMHQPLDIQHAAAPSISRLRISHAGAMKSVIVTNPKHQPQLTGIHHEAFSKEPAPTETKKDLTAKVTETPKHKTAKKDEAVTRYTYTDASTTKVFTVTSPTGSAPKAKHGAAKAQDVTTWTFTGEGTTRVFTFTSPTGTGGFSTFTVSGTAGTTGLPIQKARRAEKAVTATFDGKVTAVTFDDSVLPTGLPTGLPTTLPSDILSLLPTGLPLTLRALDNKATTAAPVPSAFPIDAPNNCPDACDAADVSCSSLMTTYSGNALCSSWFKSCHNFCNNAKATAAPS